MALSLNVCLHEKLTFPRAYSARLANGQNWAGSGIEKNCRQIRIYACSVDSVAIGK